MGLLDNTTTTSTAPWKDAQPYINFDMTQAKSLYNAGTGFNAPSFDTYAPMSYQTKTGLGAIWDSAQGGDPMAGWSQDAIQGILGGSINNNYNQLYSDTGNSAAGFDQGYGQLGQNSAADASRFDQGYGALGGISNALSGYFDQGYGALGQRADAMAGAYDAGYGALGQRADATAGADDARYNQLYQQAGNPYFDQAVQNQSDQIANDVQRQFSGLGRDGSAADTGALVDQLGRYRTQAMSDNWNQNIANQRGIASDQIGAQGANNAFQQGLLGSRYGIQQGNRDFQQGILGNRYGIQQGNLDFQHGILGDQYNVRQADFANQRGLLGDRSNLQQQMFANRRGILGDQTQGWLNAVAAAPGAYNQRFLPGQAMGQVGAAYDDLQARRLQSKIDTFNTKQQAPWNRLNAYGAAISGSGGNNAGFQAQTVTKPFDWLSALGTGLKSFGLGGL